MIMDSTNCSHVPDTFPVNNNSARDAWMRCTLEMVNFISDNAKPSLVKDYNVILLENIDLKKQNKLAIAALDSLIIGKEDNIIKKDIKVNENGEFSEEKPGENTFKAALKKFSEEKSPYLIESHSSTKKKEEPIANKKNVSVPNLPVLSNSHNFEAGNEKSVGSGKGSSTTSIFFGNNVQKMQEVLYPSCLKLNVTSYSKKDLPHLQDLNNLKQELEQAYENNKKLNIELTHKIEENKELREQIHSLELSVKTLTEAINLQDEQLSEYGSIVASLKKSRSQAIEKMKEANARNSYNVMIMSNIEQEVEHLRRQLDAYNELLVNQHLHQIDKSSSTEQILVDQSSHDDIMIKKDNYIGVLQDRLCEAIVDLKNKNCEIKNHSNSIKTLISNYEAEKKSLEDRLKSANVSAKKLEENKVKQQETMRQLMKLIEFLQQKLEKISKN